METIQIESTPKTPFIKFEPGQGTLVIKGRSIPEDAVGFYKDILDSLDLYIDNCTIPSQIEVQLEYFNTASSKCIYEILKRFEALHLKGGKATVNWNFEKDDDDIRETGEDYKSLLTLPFNIVEVDPE